VQTMSSSPSGTRVQIATQKLGEPVVHETRNYDSGGRQILDNGMPLGQGNSGNEARRIEDVTDEEEAK
jgi:hypothetical protein